MSYYDLSSGGEEDSDSRLTRLAHSLAHTFVKESDDCNYNDEPTLPHVVEINGTNGDQEDGWISDPELCAPVQLPPEGEVD